MTIEPEEPILVCFEQCRAARTLVFGTTKGGSSAKILILFFTSN